VGGELKSTLDLVMEKLGSAEAGPALSNEQKQEIAEIRKRYEAKMAETRILLAGQEELSREIARLEKDMEEKMESVRKSKAS
jgi:hypothetical protein